MRLNLFFLILKSLLKRNSKAVSENVGDRKRAVGAINDMRMKVTGEIYFDSNVRLVVRERLVYNRLPVVIDWYGYEVWRGDKKLYWYDSQPHPSDPDLQSTNPHHKHIPPNIKNHRIPAPEMSFTQPNLPTLILEIEEFINEIREQSKV